MNIFMEDFQCCITDFNDKNERTHYSHSVYGKGVYIHFDSVLGGDGIFDCYLASDRMGYEIIEIVGIWDNNTKKMKYVENDEMSAQELRDHIQREFKC